MAVWAGPDEIVWNFTAYSGLAKSAGVTKEEWYEQRPNAVKHAEARAADILPRLREGIALVRELDAKQRPFWMNEAADSHVRRAAGVGRMWYKLTANYVTHDLRAITLGLELSIRLTIRRENT
ncbi:MAG: hypothetical protein KDA99_10440 [Planctomycetales bacterium]|nr:hypothetical protein [Planctomycetales bacterium]